MTSRTSIEPVEILLFPLFVVCALGMCIFVGAIWVIDWIATGRIPSSKS